MNKKIALSGLSILSSLALIAGATFAFFSSEATSNNNAFGAGTLNLELDDNDEAFGDDANDDLITATFDVDNMAPGDSEAQEISFHNTGSIDIAEIAMGLVCTGDLCPALELIVREGGTASGGECGAGLDITTTIDTAIGGGGLPLTLSEYSGNTYDSLATPLTPDDAAAGGTDEGKVCLQVTMSDVGDEFQGDVADMDLTFTAHQDASQ